MNQEEKWLLEEKYKGVESEAFHTDLERLASGEPLGYVIGHVPFLDCKIYLDSHPLIPRPETEFWVEKAIQSIKESVLKNPRVLDLCAGSGAIGVAVAKAFPEVLVDFCEIDKQHHETIRKNVEFNNISSEQIRIFGGDLFENITDTYDFILTNPPYIDPIVDRAEESVKTHEPHIALYGGTDGMEIINRIIREGKNYLNPGGQIWIEHEPEQVEAIKKSAESEAFRTITHHDQYQVNRYSVLKYV